MAKSNKPANMRVKQAGGRNQARLQREFAPFAQAPRAELKRARGVALKMLRSLPLRSSLQPHELEKLVSGIVDVMRKEGITATHLGGTKLRDAALMLIDLREVINYVNYTLKRLKATRGGLVYLFKGKLLELFVHNHPGLRRDFKKMGLMQRDEFLNSVVKQRKKPKPGTKPPDPLIDAKGVAREVTEPFGAPMKVTKIWISDGKGNREFIDIPYVALSPKPKGTFKMNESPFYASPTVTVEIKTRGIKSEGALKGAGPQVSDQLGRWRDAKSIGMEIGEATYAFKPEDIVFNPASHTPVVVTTAKKAFPEYDIRDSRLGTREAYVVVGIPVDTSALNKIVRVLFP
jgi:hypothetical protein